MYRFFFMACLLATGIIAHGQNSFWRFSAAPVLNKERGITPESFQAILIDGGALLHQLNQLPQESEISDPKAWPLIGLPAPDGRTQRFRACESPVLAPGLARLFPGIRTFLGHGVDDPGAYLRFDITPWGFHAMVLSSRGSWFIDPFYREATPFHISYYKEDLDPEEDFICQVEGQEIKETTVTTATPVTGEQLRIYRTAVATTAEYTQFFGGTVAGALAAVATTINRVNTVYERDISARLVLVDSNHLVIFTDPATDPYSGSTSAGKMNQNQGALNTRIGSSNYDVGHVFDRANLGGIANLESVCNSFNKGRGYSSLNNPQGDPFDVDYVCHEFGHQFGATHTFNSILGACEGNRTGSTAFEPGSGSTIMAYSGLCSDDNTAIGAGDYFHVASLRQMIEFSTTASGNNCPQIMPTGNQGPTADAGPSGYVIPISTAFELIGSGIDADGDTLTYCWEQYDLGPVAPLGQPTGTTPLFRSFNPQRSRVRVFPRLSVLLNDGFSFTEVLPTYSRNMRFRLSVRDNHPGGGGADWDDMTMSSTDQAGPFRVLSQANPTTWQAGSFQTITWQVANTDQAPVNATHVDIFLVRTDAYDQPMLILENTPNDGSEVIQVPENLTGNNFRVKVKGHGNVFLDLNNADITILPVTGPGAVISPLAEALLLCRGTTSSFDLGAAPVQGFSGEVTIAGVDLPSGLQFSVDPSSFSPPAFPVLTVSGTENLSVGPNTLNFEAQAAGGNLPFSLNVTVFDPVPSNIELSSPAPDELGVPTDITFTWEDRIEATEYEIQITTDPEFDEILYTEAGLTGSAYTVPGQLTDGTTYYWRVRGRNPACGWGDFSGAGTFMTEIQRCDIFIPDGLPANFNATPFIVSRVNIEQDIIIRDLNIRNLTGSYSPVADLSFRLASPAGPTISIIPELECNTGNAFNINLDDEAELTTIPCPYNDGQTYRPLNPLSTFDGQNAKGQWRLLVFDKGNPGQLTTWELEICYPVPPTGVRDPVQSPTGTLQVFPNPAHDALSVRLDLREADMLSLELSDIAGRRVKTLQAGSLGAGIHQFSIDLDDLPAGLYVYRWLGEQGKLRAAGKVVKQ